MTDTHTKGQGQMSLISKVRVDKDYITSHANAVSNNDSSNRSGNTYSDNKL